MSLLSLTKTPREVPGALKAKLLFSNFPFWFGLFFLAFGLVLTLLFSQNIDFKSITFSPDQQAAGTIIGKEATNCSINKKRVQMYTYRFSKGQRDIIGNSYTSDNIDPYNSVVVEYESKNPQNSRIVGMDLAPFSLGFLFIILIFPAIGFGFIGYAIYQGRKNIYLVTYGILAKGKVVRKEYTNVTVNKKPLYRIIFEFNDQAGNLIQTKCTTTEPEKVMDEAEEFLVYDALIPQKAVLLDTLSKSVRKFLHLQS